MVSFYHNTEQIFGDQFGQLLIQVILVQINSIKEVVCMELYKLDEILFQLKGQIIMWSFYL